MPIRHVVLIKPREGADPAEITTALSGVEALKETVPGILNIKAGPNVSPENLNRGYTHGIVMDFDSAKSRNEYLPHPDHQAAAEKLLAITDGGVNGILVFDLDLEIE